MRQLTLSLNTAWLKNSVIQNCSTCSHRALQREREREREMCFLPLKGVFPVTRLALVSNCLGLHVRVLSTGSPPGIYSEPSKEKEPSEMTSACNFKEWLIKTKQFTLKDLEFLPKTSVFQNQETTMWSRSWGRREESPRAFSCKPCNTCRRTASLPTLPPSLSLLLPLIFCPKLWLLSLSTKLNWTCF